MEIWRILLVILVVVLLLALTYTFYSTLKYRTIADRLAYEKPPRVIDQTQNSYSIMPSQYIKKASHMQKDFIDSFIELSKEPVSSTALASTAAVIDKPKPREEGEGTKSDRSIDFLLATATTRRVGYNQHNKSTFAPNPDHTHLDISYTKPKHEPEKVAFDMREDILKIEEEVASIPTLKLFKTHIWNEFLHYHYVLALVFPEKRKKPIRHHVLYNSSVYLIVLYILSFLATELGPDSLKNFSLIAVGCVILAVLLLLVIYSIQNTEDDCLASELLPEERVGEDLVEEKTNALLIISQKRFTQEIISKLICILGITAGISMFSRFSKLDALTSRPLFGGFMVVVLFDIVLVRNILIVALTASLKSVLRKRMVKERVRALIEKRVAQPLITYGNEADKRLFTIQQEPKEQPSMSKDQSQLSQISEFKRLWRKNHNLNPETNRITFDNEMTVTNEQEETEDRRNRLMSFSDKDRPDNRVNTVPSEIHTEDITGRHKESPRGERGLDQMRPSQPSASKIAKFNIFIPPHELLTKGGFSQKKNVHNSDTSIMRDDINVGTFNMDDYDKSSDNRLQSIMTLSKALDTDKIAYEEADLDSKDNTHVHNTHNMYHAYQTQNTYYSHHTQNIRSDAEHGNRTLRQAINEEVPEEKTEVPETGEVTQRNPNVPVYYSSAIKNMSAEFIGELEAVVGENPETRRTLAKKEATPLKTPVKLVQQYEFEDGDNATLSKQPKLNTIAESMKAASIASAQKALASFKADWFESLSPPPVRHFDPENQQNPAINEENEEPQQKKEEEVVYKEEAPKHMAAQSTARENKMPASDTSLSLPYSLAYLDHDKSYNVQALGSQTDAERNSTLRRLIVRKESILSQEEFKNEVENFVKHFPKAGARRKNYNVSDSENEVEFSRNDYNLSIRDETDRYVPSTGTWKEPARESRFALHERESNRPSMNTVALEVESYPELRDEGVKGTEWMGYESQMSKRRTIQAQRPPQSYEERKSRMLQQELEKKRKKKGNKPKGHVMPSFNLDKLSEVSRSYGFQIQQKGQGHSNQDLIISKLDQKRKSASCDRDGDVVENPKLPRVTRSSLRSHRRISVDDNRREVKSLNKLSSLPEIKEQNTYKHY